MEDLASSLPGQLIRQAPPCQHHVVLRSTFRKRLLHSLVRIRQVKCREADLIRADIHSTEARCHVVAVGTRSEASCQNRAVDHHQHFRCRRSIAPGRCIAVEFLSGTPMWCGENDGKQQCATAIHDVVNPGCRQPVSRVHTPSWRATSLRNHAGNLSTTTFQGQYEVCLPCRRSVDWNSADSRFPCFSPLTTLFGRTCRFRRIFARIPLQQVERAVCPQI